MFRNCCVDNCASKRGDVPLHQFPASEIGLQKWVQCINSERLRSLTTDEIRKVFVCHKHFERRFITGKDRIRLGGYPTLISLEEIESGTPSLPQEANLTEHIASDHCYGRRHQHEDHTYSKVIFSEAADPSLQQPSAVPDLQNQPQPTALGASLDQLSRSNPQSQPEESTVSGSSLEERPALREIQNLPDHPSISGSTSKQQTIQFLTETPNLPDQPLISDLADETHQPIPGSAPIPASSGCVSTRDDQGCVARNDIPSRKRKCTSNDIDSQPEQRKRICTSKSTNPQPKQRKRMIPKVADLPPYCRRIYDEYKKSKKQLDFMKRVNRAMKFSKTQCFEKLSRNINPLAKKIMWMQITQCNKKLKGRRFTEEEKMISLAIMKQSPKAYRFLQKIFILPSRNTLAKLTSTLNVQPGINEQIFDAIKDQVKNWTENKRYCSIIFDEVKLEAGLDYGKGMDHINGFVHLDKKTNNFADHALAFMVRGAIHKWQQPITFYFCEGATKNEEFQVILKEVISAVIDTGLIPVAVISDQGKSFQSALNALIRQTRNETRNPHDNVITMKGHDINVMYDAPHLIKGIRNNFLNKNIKFEGKTCKWNDIVDVYQTDCEHAEVRLLHKLNDTHVIPDKIHKMKVKACTRVLSNTVAAALLYSSKFSHYSDGRKVSDTLRNTSEVVSFFDKLFDSCNGATLSNKQTGGKSLKKAVTQGSEHHEFWREAINKLENMKFVDEKRGEVTVDSVQNWIKTLKSYINLWHFFKSKGIKILRPRYFNSDPIENFFGQVRAYNYRNNDPTCHSFINTFKSLLITRFIKFHSTGFNCEEDSGSQLINIKKMFEPAKEHKEPETSNPPDNPTIEVNLEAMQAQVHRERLNVHSRAYTAGWVVRKVLEKNKCEKCFTDLTAAQEGSCHGWISEREYNSITKKRLSYPSECVVRMFSDVVRETNEYLEKKPHLNFISEKIKRHILSKYSFDFLECVTHKAVVLELILTVSVKFSIFNWCNIINKILKGTDIARLRRTLPPMQGKALMKYRKKLKNKQK